MIETKTKKNKYQRDPYLCSKNSSKIPTGDLNSLKESKKTC
jgi:hypothetical protein